ncbi:flavodoxin [Methanolobus psychrotolerans]|uniref:flavodoxin n=1 Tax=Methanolobus psychrotolerans TaxID=1874706 RepID=UPI000B91CF0D|nr:flavodoxin [Methanolobus psychrotolerans]
MKKTIIIYGTTTGNTLIVAEEIESMFNEQNMEVKLAEVTDVQTSYLPDYDLIILGCSTWGEGELQDDFISFEKEMNKIDLKGKQAACFGPGDSSYVFFCQAVDILEARLESSGAKIIIEGLKIDGDVDKNLGQIRDWTENILKITEN